MGSLCKRSITYAITIGCLLYLGGWQAGHGEEGPIGAPDVPLEAARFYEDALVRFEAEGYKEAILQLKNALQIDPDHLPSRILLGKVFLAAGYPKLAAPAFLRAKQMGADASLTDLPLAQSYLESGKYAELVSNIDSAHHEPTAAAAVEVLRGKAYLELGEPEQAASAFEKASSLDPEVEQPLSGWVRIHLHRDEPTSAGNLIDEAIASNPDNSEAWMLRGWMAQTRGHREEAIQYYSRAVALAPDDLDALRAQVRLLIDAGRLDEAQQGLDVLFEQEDVGPRVDYLQSIVHNRRGNRTAARESLERAAENLASLPPEVLARAPPLMLLAGTVSYALGRVEEAEEQISKYLAIEPGDARATRIKARILLARNEPLLALAAIDQAYERSANNPQLQLLEGRARLALEEYGPAVRIFERVVDMLPDNAEVQMHLARGLIGTNAIDEAIDALTKAVQVQQEDISAAVALARLHLRRDEADKAVEVLEDVLVRAPRDVRALTVLGLARARQGEYEGARDALGQALRLAPDHLPAKLDLARVDILQGRYEEARERYQILLAEEPENRDVLAALARLEEREEKLEAAIRWREKLRGYHPDATDSSLALIDLYIRTEKPQKAFALAEKLHLEHPDDFRAALAVGVSEMATGAVEDAKATFLKLSRQASYDVQKLPLIARYQFELGDLENAYWTLKKTITVRPDSLHAQVQLTRAEIGIGKVAEALQRALLLQVKYPDHAVGHTLEGNIHFRGSRYDQAEGAYRRAMAIRPSSQLAVSLFNVQRLAGRTDAAMRELMDWLADHPHDIQAREHLAGGLLGAQRYDEARAHYERLLERAPDNPVTLNNLAMIYLHAGDPRALGLAKKAYRATPDDPLFADTLGWVLVRNGKVREGLHYLREARSRKAHLPDIGYHIAVALHALGRDAEAREELEKAIASPRPFQGRAQAQELLLQLTSPDPDKP